MIDNSTLREGQSADQQQRDDSPQAGAALVETDAADTELAHRASYRTCIRMVLLLSVASWTLLIVAITWVAGLL